MVGSRGMGSDTVTRRKRRARQPEVVINALFVADRYRDTGDRFSIRAVLPIVLIGSAIMLAIVLAVAG